MGQDDSLSIADIFGQFSWHWRSWEQWKGTSWFTRFNYMNFFMFVFFVGFAIYQARNNVQRAKERNAKEVYLPAPEFPEIESLPEFNWREEQPLKLRTFKPKYNLTMALQKLNPSELILFDKNYLDRLEYHKQILGKYHDIAITVNDDRRVRGAVRELYNYLMGTYLPKRYPTMFTLHHAEFETGSTYMLENMVTKTILPAQYDKTANTKTLLENLAKTFDDDFLFLVPEDAEEGKESQAKYVLEACLAFCPSGWNPLEKIGKRLAAIHEPVPGYSKILEGSMDRYFNKVQVGEMVKRANWSITTNGELFSFESSSNHAREGDVIEEMATIDPDKTFLRCERQTVYRLPKSEAVVFSFKTYMYSMREMKEEGLGDDLAEAVDGMKGGNVPPMHFYKRGPVWGEAVKRYLRS